MKKFDDGVTVKEFLVEIGVDNILNAAGEKYEMHFELFMAFMKCFGALTKSESKVIPKYAVRYMCAFPRHIKCDNIFDAMINYCGLASVSSGRTFNIDKSRVKTIEDFANARVELVDEEGDGGITYAEQAAILLLSFCVLDEEVIDAYTDGGASITAPLLMYLIKSDEDCD